MRRFLELLWQVKKGAILDLYLELLHDGVFITKSYCWTSKKKHCNYVIHYVTRQSISENQPSEAAPEVLSVK